MVVKRIGVLSCGKVCGIMYAVFGLIAGAILSLISVFGAAIGAAASGSPDAVLGLLFGIGAIVILPVFYGVIGFIGGLIWALLYNGVASVVGGLELELEAQPGSPRV